MVCFQKNDRKSELFIKLLLGISHYNSIVLNVSSLRHVTVVNTKSKSRSHFNLEDFPSFDAVLI